MKTDFETIDYWKAIILYGLNAATYKIALGKSLLKLARENIEIVKWDDLSKSFLDEYINRLALENPKPQQGIAHRLTTMERIVKSLKTNSITYDEAIQKVEREGFNDVIPRFQTIGRDKTLIGTKFYHFEFGKKLTLHDELLMISENSYSELNEELDARWSLLEGAFEISIGQEQWNLSNDLREIYISSGYDRKNLTQNIPFLQGYQGNICFYCGEKVDRKDIHVDHVLPRQVLNHDEIWNLVISHSYCNLRKEDYLVGEYYLRKLISRNENIMGSNHPWKKKIESNLGKTKQIRMRNTINHYENVKRILGNNYWGGIERYIPEHDPFYRKLITVLNNKGI